jgi:hypothetical protein
MTQALYAHMNNKKIKIKTKKEKKSSDKCEPPCPGLQSL